MIEAFTQKFTEQRLLHVKKIGREYYQVSSDLMPVLEKAENNLGKRPYSAGLFLGEEKNKKFYSSPALLDLIGMVTDRWIMVDDNTEWLFLCGRDVFGKGVVKANVKNGLVLVANSRREVLGYGKIVGKIEDGEKVFLKNFLDKGDYLRREMSKKRK